MGVNLYDYGARFYDPALGRFLTIDPMAGATMDFTPYHYGYCNPVNFIDPSGMYSYNWKTGNYENSAGEIVTWDEVKGNNFKEPPASIDLWAGLKKAWDSFWGISARETITEGNATSEEMSAAKDQLDKSLVKMKKAEETIETVNMVLITTGTVVTGYGVAAEGGMLVSCIYNVAADAVQQGLIKGDFSDIDIANSLIAGVPGKKGISELAQMMTKELAKSYVDWKPGQPLPTVKKDVVLGTTEFVMRVTLNVIKIKGKDAGLKFGVQLFGKAVRKEFQQTIVDNIKSSSTKN